MYDAFSCITVPADALSPYSIRASAGTLMIIRLNILSYKFQQLSMISYICYWADDIIENGCQDLKKLSALEELTL